MARIEVHSDRLVIQLTPAERALGMHRRDIVLDRSRITSALITDDPWVWLRGTRALGTRLLGQAAYGTWRHLSGRDFALLRRGRHAVVIDLEDPEGADPGAAGEGYDDFARIIVSTDHAADLVQALRLGSKTDETVFTTDTA